MPTVEQMRDWMQNTPEGQAEQRRQNDMFHKCFPVEAQQLDGFRSAAPLPRPKQRPRLNVLCGLPRSGKTTWARKAIWPIVSPDAIRLALHGERFNSRAEPMVWATAQVMVRALFEAGHWEVIVDATNTTNERRKMWQHPDWQTEFVHITTPAEVCLQRAQSEGDFEIIPVIERMAKQWEPFADGLPVLKI